MTRILLNTDEDKNVYKYKIYFEGTSSFTLKTRIGEVDIINNCINIGNGKFMRMRTVYNDDSIEKMVKTKVQQGVVYSFQFRCIEDIIRNVEKEWGLSFEDVFR